MARMAFAVTRSLAPAAAIGMALVPVGDETGKTWSIEQEPLSGPGWHDSSWMLKQGLDVDENPPAEAIPPEWAWRWWLAACNA